MGRPINGTFFGNTSINGQQIQGYAWIAGDSEPRLSYIVKQRGTNSYVMASVDGTGHAAGGLVRLVNGLVTEPGQANITVSPYGSTGTGATANVYLSAANFSVAAPGINYVPGQTLLVSGGKTDTVTAGVQVGDVTLVNANVYSGGTSYAVNDLLYFNGSGWASNAILRVDSVDISGAIINISIRNSGVYTGTLLPSTPLTPTKSKTTNGSNVTINATFGINSLGPITAGGDYNVIPSNPATLTGGTGSGATANILWNVGRVNVINSGSGYDSAPGVLFNPAGAIATAIVSNNAVSSITVQGGGDYVTVPPTVTITDPTRKSYVYKFTNKRVYTYDGMTYEWLTSGQTLPGLGWATIQSA